MADPARTPVGPELVSEGELSGLIGYALRRAQVRVFQDFAAEMTELGLTPGQLGTLFLIEANRGLSQSELGAALGIDRSSVVPLIDREGRLYAADDGVRIGDGALKPVARRYGTDAHGDAPADASGSGCDALVGDSDASCADGVTL